MSTIDQPLRLDPASYRADFPILDSTIHGEFPLAYLDNAATTQRPRSVIAKVTEMSERHYANVHRGIHWLSDQSSTFYEEVREKVRAFINAEHVEEIVFTSGATMSINTVARSWGDANVRAGEEILLSEMEHHSNIVPWQQLAERTGCTIRWIPITDDGLLCLDRLDSLLSERTKLVAIAAVSNVLGTINPLEEIIAKAHSAGAKVLVDAAQSTPHARTDVRALDADFLCFSGHKMLGPSGVGVMYGKLHLLEEIPSFLGGGSMIRRVTLDGFEPADPPAKFEAGTPPIVPAIGLGTAIDYLEAIGLDRIHSYEQQLATHCHEVLSEIGGIRFLGPSPDQKAGIVSFVLEGIHAHDIAQICDRQGVAVRAGHHCAMPLHKRLGMGASTRASFYFYNTLAEVDALAEALRETKRVLRRK